MQKSEERFKGEDVGGIGRRRRGRNRLVHAKRRRESKRTRRGRRNSALNLVS